MTNPNSFPQPAQPGSPDPGIQWVWLDDGQVIKIIPVPADPIRALRGSGRGERLVEKLLEARRQDK
jgi:hypothetical protein